MEQRIKAAIAGHQHFYPWIMRHAGYLYNRYAVGPRGSTPHELLYGRAYRGQLVPLGEQVIFHKPSRARGDLQWQRGIWLSATQRICWGHLRASSRAEASGGFLKVTSGSRKPFWGCVGCPGRTWEKERGADLFTETIAAANYKEVTRLIQMGVARHPKRE